MQKNIYLSVFLGLVFNTIFFAQSQEPVEKVNEDQDFRTEVTIERTVIDENGNQTKYVVTRHEQDDFKIFADGTLDEEAIRSVKVHCDKNTNAKQIIIELDEDDNETQAKEIYKAVVHREAHNPTPKVRMGVELKNNDQGVLISHVVGNSAAGEAGLENGDIITHLDNQPITSHAELTEHLMTKDVGEKLKVTYLREGKESNARLRLKENLSHPDFAPEKTCRHLTKPCLGVRYNSWNEGIRITSIYDESGADKSGLQSKDKIVKVNDQAYTFGNDFDKMIKSQKPGSFIKIDFEREGEAMTTEAEVGVWDECGVCNLLSEMDQDEPIVEELDYILPASRLDLESFDMFPVPAREQFTVSFVADQAPVEVTLYDVNGKVIALDKLNDFSGSFTKTYDLTRAARGMAVITIEQNGKTYTEKALIQ